METIIALTIVLVVCGGGSISLAIGLQVLADAGAGHSK